MNPSLVAQWEELRLEAFGDIAASYTAVGGATEHPIRIFNMINGTDKGMFVSLDGATDHFYLPAGTHTLYDLCANREMNGTSYMIPIGVVFYLKYEADPSSGSFAIECSYGRGQ